MTGYYIMHTQDYRAIYVINPSIIIFLHEMRLFSVNNYFMGNIHQYAQLLIRFVNVSKQFFEADILRVLFISWRSQSDREWEF